MLYYEVRSAPSFIYIQDRHYQSRLFAIVDFLLSSSAKNQKAKPTLVKQSQREDFSASPQMSDLALTLGAYANALAGSQQQQQQSNQSAASSLLDLTARIVYDRVFFFVGRADKESAAVQEEQDVAIMPSRATRFAFTTLRCPPDSLPTSLEQARRRSSVEQQPSQVRLVSRLLAVAWTADEISVLDPIRPLNILHMVA